MRKNKKLFAILTLVAFMMTLMPVLAFGVDPVEVAAKEISASMVSYDETNVIITATGTDEVWKLANDGKTLAGTAVANGEIGATENEQYVVVATGAKDTDTVSDASKGNIYKISKTDTNIVAALAAYKTWADDSFGDDSGALTKVNAFTIAYDKIANNTTAVAAFNAGAEQGATIAKVMVPQGYAMVCAKNFETYYDGVVSGTVGSPAIAARDRFDETYELAGGALAEQLDALSMDADLAKKVHEAKVADKAGVIKAAIAADGVKGVVDAVKAFDAETNEATYVAKATAIVTAVPAGWKSAPVSPGDATVEEKITSGLKDSGLSAKQIKLVVDLVGAGADTTLKNEIIADYKGNGGGTTTPTTPSGVSVDASIIATKDANASIEAEGSARQDGKGGLVYTVVKDDGTRETKGLLDTKYAEVELVLREANNASFNGRDIVYVWAEESGKSRQATDALRIDLGSNKHVDGNSETIVNDNYNVYAIPVTGTETIKVAFLRAGTYTLKASIVDPTTGVGATDGLLASNVSTFKTVTNKNTVTATSLAQETRKFKVDVRNVTDKLDISANLGDGEKTTDSGANISNVIKGNKGYVNVKADTVAITKVAITVKNKNGNIMPTYPIRLSTSSANIELDATNVTTDYKGVAEFNVAGLREGEYKIYVNIGDYEGTIMVQVGATSANDIQLIKFPSNPIATDTLVADYKDIFRFQLTDANGNIVTGHEPKGAKYASIASDSDKSASEMAKYAYIVSAPEANKVKNADLKLIYVSNPDKDYYTLGIDNNKAFEAEGDYEVRVVLDNGKSATLNFSVKKFDKAVSLHIEYPTSAVELNSLTEKPDIYFLDANRVMKKANNRVTVAAQGYAVASVVENGDNAGVLKIKNDEKYVGQTITVTAASDKENLMASTTLTVADEAREVKLDTNRGPVNANNRVGFKVVDSTGAPVALGKESTVEVTAVVTNTGDQDAKVSYSVTGSSKRDLMEKGTGVINLSSNKQTTATVQIMVKVTKPVVNNQAGDNNTGLATTYYSGTETFTFGAEADKSVVMTIGSKEIVAQNVPVTIDVAPFIQDNRTYVPFRALVEAFGAEVDYNADNNTVTTKLDGKTVVLTVGSTVLTVNDETVTMDVAPFIVDDRVVVPVRFVGEAFGFTVEATQDADTGATASVVFYQK